LGLPYLCREAVAGGSIDDTVGETINTNAGAMLVFSGSKFTLFWDDTEIFKDAFFHCWIELLSGVPVYGHMWIIADRDAFESYFLVHFWGFGKLKIDYFIFLRNRKRILRTICCIVHVTGFLFFIFVATNRKIV
jgi:hypothetical protein